MSELVGTGQKVKCIISPAGGMPFHLEIEKGPDGMLPKQVSIPFDIDPNTVDWTTIPAEHADKKWHAWGHKIYVLDSVSVFKSTPIYKEVVVFNHLVPLPDEQTIIEADVVEEDDAPEGDTTDDETNASMPCDAVREE